MKKLSTLIPGSTWKHVQADSTSVGVKVNLAKFIETPYFDFGLFTYNPSQGIAVLSKKKFHSPEAWFNYFCRWYNQLGPFITVTDFFDGQGIDYPSKQLIKNTCFSVLGILQRVSKICEYNLPIGQVITVDRERYRITGLTSRCMYSLKPESGRASIGYIDPVVYHGD